MCFSPQRRAIFRHQNFQKCSRNAVFCTFSLPNVLFATAACNFSTLARTKVVQTPHVLRIFTSECAFRHSGVHFFFSELPKVLSECGVLYIFTSECAFRHSGVQLLIYPLSSDLRTRRFNRPTFRLTRHTNH